MVVLISYLDLLGGWDVWVEVLVFILVIEGKISVLWRLV